MLKMLSRTVAAATLAVVPLAACGGGSSSGGADAANADVKVHALDALKFDKTEYTAHSGDITIAYIDDGSLTHSLLIKDKAGFKLQVSGHGETKSGTINLSAGSYTIFCDLPGHEGAGMKATLDVS